MPAVRDLSGQTFGRLVVVARAPSRKGRTYWRCQCVCGTTKDVAAQTLSRGLVVSCGCYHREQAAEQGRRRVRDLVGRRFGRLTVLERVASSDSRRGARWRCRCECGGEKETFGSLLVQGTTQSCGCFARELAAERAKERALPEGEAALRGVFRRYKSQAKSRGFGFRIARSRFEELVQQECHYCGTSPSNEVGPRYGRNGTLAYNGLDRVDPTKGYTKSNVVPCCHPCNRAKSDMTLNEFQAWVLRVARRFEEKRG